jgi:transposase InsO family protein
VTRFQFVADHQHAFEVKRMCELIEVERSSFYAWKAAAPTRAARAEADAELAEKIRAIHAEDNTIGAPRATAELNEGVAPGERVNHKRVARVMHEHAIRGYQRKRRVRTTIPEPSEQKVPDLLNRDFTAHAPNRKYVGDITYLPVADGTNLYLATVIDCYSRRVAGWAIADHMRVELVQDALNAAAATRGSLSGAIFHSDHGSVGGFNRSSQHLDDGGVGWDCRGSRCRKRRPVRGGRRCGHRDVLSRRGRCSASSGA